MNQDLVGSWGSADRYCQPHFYQVGGSLSADAPAYVERQADQDLYQALLAGEYCYILDARQMGKSSLRTRTLLKLESENITCVSIDLLGIVSHQITPQQWYGGLMQMLILALSLPLQRHRWIQERQDLSPVQQLGELIDWILHHHIHGRLVIFIDEMDSVLRLNFPVDDFFALLRSFYNNRSTDPIYQRISFALLGATTPAELIRHPDAAPFNIGRSIPLSGFQFHECRALVEGLRGRAIDPAAVLQAVLHWTGGQPFLTQKLCALLCANTGIQGPIPIGEEATIVGQVVHRQILNHWEAQDTPEHLITIRDQMLSRGQASLTALKLYRRLLRRGSLLARSQHPDQLRLRLAGVIEQQNGSLVIKNPIYRAVFTLEWVDRELHLLQPQPVRPSAWIVPIASGLMTLMVVGVRSWGGLQGWELQAFDQMMRVRPLEDPDPRLALIEVTEADVRSQPYGERGAASLSDRTLELLLRKVMAGQPQAIGLTILREEPIPVTDLRLTGSNQDPLPLFAICFYGSPGVAAPPKMPATQQGFTNAVLDSDGVLRRQLVAVSSSDPCQSNYGLAWQIATDYLRDQGFTTQTRPDDNWQIGDVVFRRLGSHAGGYQGIDASGYQLLINYRNADPVAETWSLGKVLSEDFDEEILRDRIVLIGTSAPSFKDHNWRTPYTGGQNETMLGIEIQAHLISQILSSVLDQRSLMWWWDPVWEILWIWGWSSLGGLLAYSRPSSSWIRVMVGGAVVGLCGSCWLVFLFGGWIPLLPSLLGLIGTTVGIIVVDQRQTLEVSG